MRTALVSESVIDAPKKKRTREHRDRRVIGKWAQLLRQRHPSRRRNLKSPRVESEFGLAGLKVSGNARARVGAFAKRPVTAWRAGVSPRSRHPCFVAVHSCGLVVVEDDGESLA